MIPVVTPEEMGEVDRSAPEPVDVLVGRAAWAVAGAARRMLSGTYGRRVLVVAGPGNNGADGRTAASILQRWGAGVDVVDARELGPQQRLSGRGDLDLIIDAAYGTGLSRPYEPPDPGETPVLAVDIPSGLSGSTGLGRAMRARLTVTFEALKPGLLLGEGPEHCGVIEVAPIGLRALVDERAGAWVVTDEDVRDGLPDRPRQGHKWQTAVEVVGGSPTMNGAPLMVAHTAMRAGAGYALVGVPGTGDAGGMPPSEAVALALTDETWVAEAAAAAGRVKALAIGPGLGARARGAAGTTGDDTPVARLLGDDRVVEVPAVVDADGITALGDLESMARVVARRRAPTVLTPHEGEYQRITGHKPGEDRITDVRDTARQTGAVTLLKGSPTIVCDPGGRTLLACSGTARLATAGSGDALTGIIAAFLARGVPALEAAAFGAHAHGRAAERGRAEGLVASDLADLVSEWLSDLEGGEQ